MSAPAVAGLALAALAACAGAWAFHALRAAARRDGENAQFREAADDVQKAGRIRDRLVSDPSYARRVRARFTRS